MCSRGQKGRKPINGRFSNQTSLKLGRNTGFDTSSHTDVRMYDEILRNAVNIGEWGKRVNKMMRAQETKNKTLKSRARSKLVIWNIT